MQQDRLGQRGGARITAEEYNHSLSKLVGTKRRVKPSRKAAFMAAFPVKASPRLHPDEERASALPLKEASITDSGHSTTPNTNETSSNPEVNRPVGVRHKLQIFVRGLLLPKTLCLQLDPETSVSALKAHIQAESGIQPQQQHLYIGRNFQLCDLLSIRDHGIQQDQNIELLVGGLLGGGLEEEQLKNRYFLNLSSQLGQQWEQLALYLGFSIPEIEALQKNDKENLQQQSFKMLDTWWKKQDNPEDAPAKLRDALKETGRADLALQVHVPDACCKKQDNPADAPAELSDALKDVDRAGLASQVQGEKQFPLDGPNIVNHYHFGNVSGPINIGPGSGNTVNYGPEVRVKLEGPPELILRMVSMIDEKGENSSITMRELQQNCDCNVLRIRKGCVELTLRVGSQKGLEKLLAMCNSGDLKQLLGREFPVNGLRLVEEDIVQARKFFEEEKAKMKNELRKKVQEFEDAAGEYVRRRVKTLKLLRDLVEYITRRQRQAQAAATVGGVSAGLAAFTFGASYLLSAAAVVVVVGIVAIIVQAVTAKISTDEAKMTMAKDKVACDRVQETLEKVDLTLREWEVKEEGVLIGSIDDLVRVDKVNLKRGEDAIETIEGPGRGEFVQFVVLILELDKIIVYILDTFTGDVSRMAKAIQEIADKLACPNEASMRELVSKIKTRFQLDNN